VLRRCIGQDKSLHDLLLRSPYDPARRLTPRIKKHQPTTKLKQLKSDRVGSSLLNGCRSHWLRSLRVHLRDCCPGFQREADAREDGLQVPKVRGTAHCPLLRREVSSSREMHHRQVQGQEVRILL
jgi:hypothetical protein